MPNAAVLLILPVILRRRRGPLCAAIVALVALAATTARAQTPVDTARARLWFEEAAALCAREAGRLWGVALCGPMVFADGPTRSLATNQPSPAVDRPPTLGFVNAPIEWGGTRWAAYVWSFIPADDAARRGRLLVHELFHRIQPQLGLMLVGPSNDHLDTLEGRYWLQLEWRALARALATTGDERVLAVRDALAFRATRRSLFEGAAEGERVDEIREGLAQYTGTVVATSSAEAAVVSAIRQLDEYAAMPTYVRVFAYPSGVAWGLLLDAWSPGWTRSFDPSADLGALVMAAAGVQPAADASAAATRYGGSALLAAEEKRQAEQKARIAELRRRFVDGPVLIVPRARDAVVVTTGATPIPGEGTVIFQYRVTGEWGSLESNGILESADGRTLRLPAPFRIDGATVQGDGWTVTLAAGWMVRPGARAGDFEIARGGDAAGRAGGAADQDPRPRVDAIVGMAYGDARLNAADGRSASLRADAVLGDGDTLVTGGGRARVDLLAGGGALAELAIGPHTSIVMTADTAPAGPARTHPRTPRVTAGAMHWTSARRPAVPVLLAARFAGAVLVPRSADFIVVYDPLWNQGSVYLRAGALTLHLPDSAHEMVAGQAVAVFQGRISSVAPLEAEAWAQLVSSVDGPAIAGSGYDITFRDFASGPIAGGNGETRFDGTTLDVTAPAARQAWFPLAAEQVDGYAASAILSVADATTRALAGLYLTDQNGADCADGDIFFGRDARGILLQSCRSGAWNDHPLDVVPALAAASRFAIDRAGDLYTFRLDDATVATLRLPDRAPDYILFFVGPGSRAAVRDWRVAMLR